MPDFIKILLYLQVLELQKGKPLSLELVPCLELVWVGAAVGVGFGVCVVVRNRSRVVCLRPVGGVSIGVTIGVVVGVGVGGGV